MMLDRDGGPAPAPSAAIPAPAPTTAIPEPTPDNSGKAQTGRIIELDLNGTLVMYTHADGRADAPVVVNTFNVQDGLTVSDLKATDYVVFTAAQVGGAWTITKIQKQ